MVDAQQNQQVDEIIKEIALVHNISVGRDDPIMILQTINNRLLRDGVAAQQAMLDHFKEELETISHRWGEDAKTKAERVLNAALTASNEMAQIAMQNAANESAKTLRRELAATTAKLVSTANESKRIAMLNIVAAIMTLVAAGIVLFVAK
jgi:hypothetical protein